MQYGSEVAPQGPVQDMWAIDTIAGSVHDRDSSPAETTGGDTGSGLGGVAEGLDTSTGSGTVKDRIGF